MTRRPARVPVFRAGVQVGDVHRSATSIGAAKVAGTYSAQLSMRHPTTRDWLPCWVATTYEGTRA